MEKPGYLRWGCAALFISTAVFASTGDRQDTHQAMNAALAKISAQCPQTYPDQVTPVPSPEAAAGLSDAVLLAMLDSWNPALRLSAASELGRRGEGVIDALMQALASENPNRRAGALEAFSRMIMHQVQEWKTFKPQVLDENTAQDSIRRGFAERLLEDALRLARDPAVIVRSAALSLLGALKVLDGRVAEVVLGLGVDKDEYLADQALSVIGKINGLASLEDETLIPMFRQALRNPLPRGKGAVIQWIAQSEESFQRALAPDLLAHLDWQPDRDTMFGASGQAEALTLLATLRVKELVPRLPGLMNKTMRGPGLFDDCIAAIKTFGTDAAPILPVLQDRIAKEAAELNELTSRQDRDAVARREHLQKRLEALREAVGYVHVE